MAPTKSDPLKTEENGVDMPVIDYHVLPNQMAPQQQHLPTPVQLHLP
jgi:hypothetical protein